MAYRHLQRTIALQTLFAWDFNHGAVDTSELVREVAAEFSGGLEDSSYAERLVEGVVTHATELDRVIARLAPQWPVHEIAGVDRTILRLGIFELQNARDIPPKVIINEAVEMAKHFGGDNAGGFINGVLGALLKEQAQSTQEVSTNDTVADSIQNKPNID